MAVHKAGDHGGDLRGDWIDSIIDTFLATGSARARWHAPDARRIAYDILYRTPFLRCCALS